MHGPATEALADLGRAYRVSLRLPSVDVSPRSLSPAQVLTSSRLVSRFSFSILVSGSTSRSPLAATIDAKASVSDAYLNPSSVFAALSAVT